MGWLWVLLGISLAQWLNWFHPRLLGKGRILSRPFYRVFRRPPWTRTNQILVWFAAIMLNDYLFHLLSKNLRVPVYYAVYSAWYLDDYFTGDDDKWKKFWDLVRNKIKWKMEIPVTSNAGQGGGVA